MRPCLNTQEELNPQRGESLRSRRYCKQVDLDCLVLKQMFRLRSRRYCKQVDLDCLVLKQIFRLRSRRYFERASFVDAFNSDLQHEFVENKLLHQCLHCIKKGSSKETSLASHVIGLLALTVGLGDQAQEILENNLVFNLCWWSQSRANREIYANYMANDSPETRIVTYLSSLLEKDDRSVRIAAGEALALIFELGTLEKFAAEAKGSAGNGSVKEGSVSQEALMNMRGLKSKVTNQVRDLATEAGGKGSAKKDLNMQRSLFKDLVEFLEDGVAPETSTKVGGDSLQTTTWYQMIQLNFLKHFKHMQENEFLRDVFSFTPKKIG
ncbi:hypothetical protein F2Q69_00054079 [Brassica cretica]|uniref:Interferon-related developmental regulator N-terminal domain-containing protein n=1 Tax=Brassica cretica TaxID=69181 RepID=A0A8S9MYY7_BRACR|nr:hypothetical protein F2Q69_00054079 [Brassica cretica]